MADPYGMSFGERGRGGSPAANQQLMEQHMANVYADPGPSQAEVDRANRENAAYAATVRMRQNAEAAEAEAIARGAADLGFGLGYMPPAYSEPEFYRSTLGAVDLGYGPGYMPPVTPVATPMTDAQIQAARGVSPIMQSYFPQRAGFDLYQDVLGDASAAARANIAAASPGLFGIPTRFMNEKFLTGLGSRMGGRDSDAYQKFLSDQNLFEPVYDQAGRLTGYRDQYGRLTGRDTLEAQANGGGDDDEQVVPTVTNPATGREECPDGYTFDPDLNACRLDTRGGTTTAPDAPAAPGVPGAQYARMGLLDVAPEGLMGFQERYGAGFGTPADFGAANLAFRQQGAISPEYYQTPPKLTGYTLLG